MESLSPFTGKARAVIPNGNSTDVDIAVQAAIRAQALQPIDLQHLLVEWGEGVFV